MKEIYDIIREMRRLGKLDKKSNNRIPRSLMGLCVRTYADRIEAAVKTLESDRDNWRRQALDEDARANATHKDSLVVGDMAAMREAFEEMLAWYDELHDDVAAMDAAMEKARAALAKPPRNCDLLADAHKALSAIHNDRCYVQNPIEERKLTVNWLFAEAKGEQK